MRESIRWIGLSCHTLYSLHMINYSMYMLLLLLLTCCYMYMLLLYMAVHGCTCTMQSHES